MMDAKQAENLVWKFWEVVSHGRLRCANIPGRENICFDCDDAGAWLAAAAFTEDRLEQIRQVEEEIDFLFEGAIPHRNADIRSRILAREQAALADLKRGMR